MGEDYKMAVGEGVWGALTDGERLQELDLLNVTLPCGSSVGWWWGDETT